MSSAQIMLNDQDRATLESIVRQSGKSQEEVIREALRQLALQFEHRQLLRQAKGIWRDRDDLPALADLRAELDRKQVE